MVHELALQVVPHFRFMFYQLISRRILEVLEVVEKGRTVQLARPLHGIIRQREHLAGLKHECYNFYFEM